MSTIYEVKDCTGCGACLNICPFGCITLAADEEGFLFPTIDDANCSQCGLCYKKCPQKHVSPASVFRQEVYAVQLKDSKILKTSSSGGMFSAVADYVLSQSGAVFGCTMGKDKWEATHIYVENSKDLDYLRGSKYVQSNTGNTYELCREKLESGNMVLYSGTPCQIAGLYSYLGKDYENLITIDLVCHGVCSPSLFQMYIRYLENKYNEKILDFDFRNKIKFGWGLCSTILTRTKIRIRLAACDRYMTQFKAGLSYRECCYSCKYAKTERMGDITIGDYWGVSKFHPELDTFIGVSLLMVNTSKGQKVLSKITDSLDIYQSKLEWVVEKNENLVHPTKRPPIRDDFYRDIDKLGFERAMNKNVKTKPMLLNYILYLMPKESIRFLKSLKN